MRNRQSLVGLALAAALSACSLSPDSTTPLPAEPTTGSPTELQVQPSSTPPPLIPPTDLPTLTATALEEVTAFAKEELVNCRFGPGTVYIVIGQLKEGQSARVVGRDAGSAWYYVHDPGNPDGFCWLAADVVEIEGNPEALAVVSPPAPSVTDITVGVEPNRMVVPCSQFPQVVYITAEVTTDGPALVTYRWEASTGVSSVDNAIAFEEAGTQTIQDYYQIGAPNDYWIGLHVLGPNDLSEQTNFRVICNP